MAGVHRLAPIARARRLVPDGTRGPLPCAVPLAGPGHLCLMASLPRWEVIGAPSEVLRWIRRGLAWSATDSRSMPWHTTPSNPEIGAEVSSLLTRGVVELVPETRIRAASKLFAIPKTNGGRRVILDLREVNAAFQTRKIRLPTFAAVAAVATPGSWAAVIDIAAAFYNVRVSPSLASYFGFIYEGKAYRFLVCPFGFTGSPWAWNRLFRPALRHLRKLLPDLSLVCYVDDILIVGRSQEDVRVGVERASSALSDLGFSLKLDERSKPAQRIVFLGFELDCRQSTLVARTSKTGPLSAMAARVARAPSSTRRQLARLLGGLRALRPGMPWILTDTARLSNFLGLLSVSGARWETRLSLPRDARLELLRLAPELRRPSPVQLVPPPPDWSLTTDASGWAWGAVTSDGDRVSRLFSPGENSLPASIREALAVLYALQFFRPQWAGRSVQVRSDATVVVSSIQARRARAPALIPIMTAIRDLSAEMRGLVSAHVPGRSNVEADLLSRQQKFDMAHVLFREAFRLVTARIGLQRPIMVDLFGSASTAQTSVYVSARYDEQAIACNAFTARWDEWPSMWANPPWTLINRALGYTVSACLNALRDFELVLVTPEWAGAPWWSLLERIATRSIELERALRWPRKEFVDARIRAWLISSAHVRATCGPA